MGNPPILGQQPRRTPCIECRHCRSVITEPGPDYLLYAICGFDYGRRTVTCYRTGCSNWESAATPKMPGRWRERLEKAKSGA